MNLKRVLIVTTTNLGFNGITSVIMNYYRNIDRSKVQFDFAIGEEIHETIAEEIKELGGIIYQLPSRKKKTIKFLKELKQLVKEKKYEIVHVHGNSGTLYFDIHALKKMGVPMRIAHSHNSTCNYKIIHKLLKNKLNQEMTCGIACSKLAGDWLFDKEYIILNNGIDIEKFKFNEKVRKEYRSKLNVQDKFVIGHIGHFSYQKNHEYLIKVFSEVVRKKPNSVLMLLGDGKLRNDIENQIDRLGIKENVLLLGKRQDAAELMQAMDVFVFPSRFEGLPVALVEAQASGLKCIVSDTITNECNIINNISFLGLNDSKKWIDEILLAYKKYKRDNVEEIMKKSKFNIKEQTNILERIYLGSKVYGGKYENRNNYSSLC